jgi:hypothetical protein
LFNRDDMPLIDELADRARLARLPKEYFLEGPTRKWDLGNEGGPLPLEITPATATKASLVIADDPAQAREVSLEMQFSGAFEPPAITLNSHPLTGLTTKREAGLTLTLASAELKKALKRGLNEFSLTPAAGDNCGGLVLAPEWTIFGPCDKTDSAPATAGLAVCPATLRLGDRELAARQVKATNLGINLSELFGGHRERQGAWVFITVIAPRDGRYVIGLGADWWLEAFLDGKPLLSTLETGNKRNNHPFIKPNRNDQIAMAELRAGVHTLAVRVLSGSAGWMLDAGIDVSAGYCQASPMTSLLQTGFGMFSARAGRGRTGCAEKRILITRSMSGNGMRRRTRLSRADGSVSGKCAVVNRGMPMSVSFSRSEL